MRKGLARQPKRWMFAAALLVGAWLAQQAGVDVGALLSQGSSSPPATAFTERAQRSGTQVDASGGVTSIDRIERAFAARESGFMVTVDARVERVLSDDRDGSRHQRFLIELDGGRTLLVAHNIDLADRMPLSVGDAVRVRGQYEWNDRGGVLHWTHHDPDGSHPGGFIESQGRRVE